MQNKGLIKGFTIILALICLYQLSFTFLANKVESQAQQAKDNGQVPTEAHYLDSVANLDVVSFLPGLTYKQCRSQELNLGLDLQGGMSVVLEVSVDDILSKMVGDEKDPLFRASIARAKEMEKDAQENFVDLFTLAFAEENQKTGGQAKLHEPRFFGTSTLSPKFPSLTASDEEVLKIVRTETDGAIDRAFTIISARIDKFGVAQPNIQKMEQSGRILIELPGVKDADRIKKLLKSTAQLEFWETENGGDLLNFLVAANTRLAETEVNPNEKKESDPELNTTTTGDGNSDIDDILNAEGASDKDSTVANTSSDSLDLADQFSPLFQILIPNINQQTGQPNPGPVVGTVNLKDTATVNRYLSRKDIRQLLPSELRYTQFTWTAKPILDKDKRETEFINLIALRSNRKGKPSLSGDVIVDASSGLSLTGGVEIDMQMNTEGARKWKKLTGNNIGKAVAIVLDNAVYSYPNVNGEIPNGRSQISGDFTIEEGTDLANILKAGKLPAVTRIIQADEVGASLGEKAVDDGLTSFMIALLFVLVYMFFYYSNAGLAADVALLFNMFFVLGVLASFNAVLTLPGIAGVVLTIGMAVDANVLIFERIKEELSKGKNQKSAIADGYRHAYAAIIDANVTTLLTGIVLALFGTGPIRGFAVTLIIGILTSVFSAIFITRLVLDARASKNKNIKFYTGLTKNLFQNTNIQFISKKKIAYLISGLIIAAGITSMVTRTDSFNQGVDFKGGRSFVIKFTKDIKTDDVRQTLSKVFVDENGNELRPTVKTFGAEKQVKITTKYLIDKEDADDEVLDDLSTGLSQLDPNFHIESSSLVGPTIADDIKKSAFWSILGSLIIIFLYILLRFGKWQFSLGAVVAVFHDVLIVLSLFSIFHGRDFLPFSLEIDQAFIAAILTVIGYSLNDTVVVFDRIRERLSEGNEYNNKEKVNKALNSTLSRTMNTSLTTLIVLLVIFFMGGEVIQGFMFALLVGVVVGTYSSLFIATPITLDTLSKKKE